MEKSYYSVVFKDFSNKHSSEFRPNRDENVLLYVRFVIEEGWSYGNFVKYTVLNYEGEDEGKTIAGYSLIAFETTGSARSYKLILHLKDCNGVDMCCEFIADARFNLQDRFAYSFSEWNPQGNIYKTVFSLIEEIAKYGYKRLKEINELKSQIFKLEKQIERIKCS